MFDRRPNDHMLFAAWAWVLAKGKGDLVQSVELSKHLPEFYRSVLEPVARSAVPAGTTSDPTWAAPLAEYRQVTAGIVASLRNASGFDAMLPFAVRAPLRTALAIFTAALTGQAVDEFALKPVTRMTLEPGALDPYKTGFIIVLSDAVLRFSFSAALDAINSEIRKGLATGTDAVFLAALVDGLTPIASDGDPLHDLRNALAAMLLHAGSRLFWIVTRSTYNQLALYSYTDGVLLFPQFPNIAGITVIASDGLPEDTSGPYSIVADATQLVLADEVPTLRSTSQGDVLMDDDPSGGAHEMVSMFATNSVALLGERWIGVGRVRDGAVAVIDGSTYEAAS